MIQKNKAMPSYAPVTIKATTHRLGASGSSVHIMKYLNTPLELYKTSKINHILLLKMKILFAFSN